MGTGAIPPPARRAGSLPNPGVPAGTPNGEMPFDHLIVVMMENHSFDNLLGALSATRPDVEGLTFDPVTGRATNSNPGTNHTPNPVFSFPAPNTAQAKNVSQSWKATHNQINGGAMDGFVRASGAIEPMGYYTPEVLPFAYSLAEHLHPGQPLVLLGSGSHLSEPPLPARRNRVRRNNHRRRHAVGPAAAERDDL